MMARRERQGTRDRGDDLSLDHPNTHTLDRCLFISVRSKEKAGPSVLARVSCRLASSRFLPSGFGEIAQIGPGRPRE